MWNFDLGSSAVSLVPVSPVVSVVVVPSSVVPVPDVELPLVLEPVVPEVPVVPVVLVPVVVPVVEAALVPSSSSSWSPSSSVTAPELPPEDDADASSLVSETFRGPKHDRGPNNVEADNETMSG